MSSYKRLVGTHCEIVMKYKVSVPYLQFREPSSVGIIMPCFFLNRRVVIVQAFRH